MVNTYYTMNPGDYIFVGKLKKLWIKAAHSDKMREHLIAKGFGGPPKLSKNTLRPL